VRPAAAIRSTTSTQTVQSLFFPSLNDDAYNSFTVGGVVAITELSSCASLCSDADDRCLLMAGFTGAGKLSVAQYCVPSALSRGVSKAGSWETLGISGLSTEIQFIKATISGGWRDVYCVVGMQDQKMQACVRQACAEFKPSDVDLNTLGFQQMQSLGDVIMVQMRVRKGDLVTYCLRFMTNRWRFAACGETGPGSLTQSGWRFAAAAARAYSCAPCTLLLGPDGRAGWSARLQPEPAEAPPPSAFLAPSGSLSVL
jgi:hypothetical protein